jgi:hypothetical protein
MAVALEEHMKQAVSRNRNDEKYATDAANGKHPHQNSEDRLKHCPFLHGHSIVREDLKLETFRK